MGFVLLVTKLEVFDFFIIYRNIFLLVGDLYLRIVFYMYFLKIIIHLITKE